MRPYEIWRHGYLRPHSGKLLERLSSGIRPVVANVLRYLLSEWEYLPRGWRMDVERGHGWNDASMATREFIHAEGFFVRGAPRKGECRGYLFRRLPTP